MTSAMSAERKPFEIINTLVTEREKRSDCEVLSEIEDFPPLADESDPVWDECRFWTDFAYRYVALSDLAAIRKLRPAVRLLLERACNGDPGEKMRELRHCFKAIFGPDRAALADVCIALCRSDRQGTRWWAMDQLVVLDDPRAKPVFEHALADENEEVRRLAAVGLKRLARAADLGRG